MSDQIQVDHSQKNRLSFRSDLEQFFDANDIKADDCCIVGSVCLSIRGIREHGDIDVCIAPSQRDSIEVVNAPIELAPNKYEHIGISDETIIYDESYHDIVNGLKIIRPEIEYSHKLYRQWEKDKNDIDLINQYKQASEDWNNDLVVDDYSPSVTHVLKRGYQSLRRDGVRKTINYGIEFARRHGPLSRKSKGNYETKPISLPSRAIQSYQQAGIKKTLQRGINLVKSSDPTGVLSQYSNINHKIKLATLVDDRFILKYDTAEFLGSQYRREEFIRHDVIIYLLTIEQYNETSSTDFALYNKLKDSTDIPPVTDFLQRVDDFFENKERPPIPIGYSSEILDPVLAACTLFDRPTEFEVVVKKPNTTINKCTIDSLRRNSFSEEEVQKIQSRHSELLNEHGVLFEVIFWPPAAEYFDEIKDTISEEEIVHSCTQITFGREKFDEFVYALYETQTKVRWEYIEQKTKKIRSNPSKILSVQLELPDPRIREQNSHEMKEIKERYRARYNPKIAPEDPNSRRTIHATDNYMHNRETRQVLTEYLKKAEHIDEIFSKRNKH